MASSRYFGVRRFTIKVIDAHANGKQIKAAGCSGNIQTIFYNDEALGEYTGSFMAFGTQVRATSYPEYVYTLNRLLDEGATIHEKTAQQVGRVIMCSYTSKVDSDYEKKNDTESKIQVDEVQAETGEVKASVSEATVAEEVEELSVDAAVSPETESEVSSEETPDWSYAASLVDFSGEKGANKTALKSYAETFGIKLSKKSGFEKMLAKFKSEYEG